MLVRQPGNSVLVGLFEVVILLREKVAPGMQVTRDLCNGSYKLVRAYTRMGSTLIGVEYFFTLLLERNFVVDLKRHSFH